ncbi:MAG: sigma-70 family RNA polymerase sigma factor [Phycisphaeraceae bacterium]|nr:MAG: sigma-70 family RNA polymerase sigma factor [Phycisphaeraceae bacterium]
MRNDCQHLDDAELLAACLEGSDDAWSELVERYARLVYSIPARHGLPGDLCDEVFQSVWTIAVRHLGSLRDARSLPAWLIRATQRETWRITRAARRTSGLEAPEELTWTDPDEASLIEDRQRMREALAQIGDRCRELLLILFREDRPDYDRVAERLGIPRGSIGPTRGRCLDKLRSIYGDRTLPRAE